MDASTTRITVKNHLSGTSETMSGKHGMLQKNESPVWWRQEKRDVSRHSRGRAGVGGHRYGQEEEMRI